MTKRQRLCGFCALLAVLLFALPVPGVARKHAQKKPAEDSARLAAVLWHDPGDPASLNLFYGPGGEKHAPDPNSAYKFAEEDLDGKSPKFNVVDAQGVRWKIKVGPEARSETAATRLLWAAGYFVDEDYYVPELKVSGLPKLSRGNEYVEPGGVVRGARLERHRNGMKKLGHWDWFENPFTGRRELNGLRVMMAVLNNWDGHSRNNEIYQNGKERIYEVADVGAAFGKGGSNLSRNKSVLRDYVASRFIDKTTPETVNFAMESRFVLGPIVRFGGHSRLEKVVREIPRADARWIGQRLAQLTDAQIRDSFRAAGYAPDEVDGYAKVVEKRIAELNAL